jgi:hypothetical protein
MQIPLRCTRPVIYWHLSYAKYDRSLTLIQKTSEAHPMHQQEVREPYVHRDNSFRVGFNPTDLSLIKDLPEIKDFSDWLLFYYYFPHKVGDMFRFVIYRVYLTVSTNYTMDVHHEYLCNIAYFFQLQCTNTDEYVSHSSSVQENFLGLELHFFRSMAVI